ncbi:hypothetical protein [Nocardia yamanashiensis]|uniref:hypothetical protein n=1 Tax=Nocardia yamanashiensis TaxID=209247 RepID=UPI000A72FE71|nr:hypothetical protein [Nocardia yamanashiensis]
MSVALLVIVAVALAATVVAASYATVAIAYWWEQRGLHTVRLPYKKPVGSRTKAFPH